MKEIVGRLSSEDLLEWRETVATYEALETAGHTFSKEEARDAVRRRYEHAAELAAVYLKDYDMENETRDIGILADTGRIILED